MELDESGTRPCVKQDESEKYVKELKCVAGNEKGRDFFCWRFGILPTLSSYVISYLSCHAWHLLPAQGRGLTVILDGENISASSEMLVPSYLSLI